MGSVIWVHHRVNLHGDVILGDYRLGGIVQCLLLQIHPPGNPVDEGNLHVQAYAPHRLEGAQPLNDHGLGLLNDHNVGYNQNKEDNQHDADNDKFHNPFSFLIRKL